MSVEKQQLTGWLRAFSRCIREEDYNSAIRLFDPEAFCFGSRFPEPMCGIDELRDHQWQAVWPNIRDFRFQEEELRYIVSEDGCTACLMLPWHSTGFDDDQVPFERPGRVTLILKRVDQTRWVAVHSHFSLKPGWTR